MAWPPREPPQAHRLLLNNGTTAFEWTPMKSFVYRSFGTTAWSHFSAINLSAVHFNITASPAPPAMLSQGVLGPLSPLPT